MGTNYYIMELGYRRHIGKRSFEGVRCLDHGDMSEGRDMQYWGCAICGKGFKDKRIDIDESKENIEDQLVSGGVIAYGKFTWAMEPNEFFNLPDDKLIRDEYNRDFTMKQLREMIRHMAPVWNLGMIGREFS